MTDKTGEGVGDSSMAMIPAERSVPGRRLPGSGAWVEEPFWGAVVVIVFMSGMIILAKSALVLAEGIGSHMSDSLTDLALPAAGCVLGSIIVIGLLIAFGQHPRTRSGSATASFAAMRVLMFVGGIVLFLGGALRMIQTVEFTEQVVLALLSLFFLGTPLYLQFAAK